MPMLNLNQLSDEELERLLIRVMAVLVRRNAILGSDRIESALMLVLATQPVDLDDLGGGPLDPARYFVH